MALRSVCREFLGWAINEILRSRIITDNSGGEIEVYFSELATLKRKFKTDGVGVGVGLVGDFPSP